VTYRRCDLATETGAFGIFDCRTGEAIQIETDAACRRLAEDRYPGCTFAMTATASIELHPANPVPLPDVVVIAVCLRSATGTAEIHAYIFGAVHGPQCVPFTPDVWTDAYDLLTRRN